jgi:tetratricopeptide (TPR) repeat protein
MDLRGWLVRSVGGVLITLVSILPLAFGPARADEASDAFKVGVRLLEEHKPREAVASFKQVARLRPDYPQVFAYLGDARLQLQEYDQAAASYKRSLEIDRPGKECLRALNGLGCAYLGLTTAPKNEGLVWEAIACFDQAIKVSPQFAPAYNNRGRAYHLQRELNRAIADFDKAIEFDPGYADACENRAKAWKEKGDEKRAEADFAKARKLRAKQK